MDAAAAGLNVTLAEPNIGARVEGVDLAEGADAALVTQLRQLLLEHHVLVLPGQDLPAQELEAFARQWGDLLKHPTAQHEDTPYIQFIPGSAAIGTFGNWHSDMTWHPTPPVITMLHARLLPDSGGDTCFVNQHLAYETMPAKLRDVLDDANGYHSGQVFGPGTPDSTHPAVRTHDESGRRALYINRAFTTHLVDVDPAVSRKVMDGALLHATRVDFLYRHRWTLHDLVIWDNRSVMHCPVVDYEGKRHMHRAVVKGNVPV